MHSRILKLSLLGAVLLLTLPVMAFAQTSRVEGMSLQGDYIKDYTGIYTYPSNITSVGNLVYGELGVSAGGAPQDRAVGAVMGDWWEGRYGVWGIHLRQFTPQMGQGDATSAPSPGETLGLDPNFNTQEQFDLMWGKKFGTTSFGLRFNRSFGELELENNPLGLGNIGDAKFDFTQADPNLSRNVMGFAAGVTWEMSPSTNVDIAAHYQTRDFEVHDTTGVTLAESDGNSSYQVAARMWWQWQPNVMVVPVLKYYQYDLSTNLPAPGPGSTNNTLKGWQAGLAGNWTVGSNDLFVLGMTFAQNTLELAGVNKTADEFLKQSSASAKTNADLLELSAWDRDPATARAGACAGPRRVGASRRAAPDPPARPRRCRCPAAACRMDCRW